MRPGFGMRRFCDYCAGRTISKRLLSLSDVIGGWRGSSCVRKRELLAGTNVISIFVLSDPYRRNKKVAVVVVVEVPDEGDSGSHLGGRRRQQVNIPPPARRLSRLSGEDCEYFFRGSEGRDPCSATHCWLACCGRREGDAQALILCSSVTLCFDWFESRPSSFFTCLADCSAWFSLVFWLYFLLSAYRNLLLILYVSICISFLL